MTDNPRLKEFLPYQLSITSNAVSGRIALEYRTRFGLSVPEWRVMAVLGDSGALTQRDLTWMTLMDKVAVNRACKVLEERGLVERRRERDDRRVVRVSLTPDGLDLLHRAIEGQTAREGAWTAVLDDEEVAQLVALLGRLVNQERPA